MLKSKLKKLYSYFFLFSDVKYTDQFIISLVIFFKFVQIETLNKETVNMTR